MIWAGWYGIPLPSAKLAVDLFMVISGYLMVVHADEREVVEPMSKPSTWLRFYVRRYFRIAPAYYLSLAVAVLLSGAFLGGYTMLRHQNPAWGGEQIYDPAFVHYTATNLALHVTFLFGLLPDYAFSTFLPDWSLGLEMQFYLAFPFILLAMRRLGPLKVAIALCAICLPFAKYADTLHGMRGGHGLFVEPSLLLLKIQFFLIGMLIARMQGKVLSLLDRAATWSVCLALSLSQVWIYGHETWVMFALVLIWLHITTSEGARARKWIDTVSETRVVSYMSRASYSVYLFHGFFIALAGSYIFPLPGVASMNGPARAGLMFVIVIAGAYGLAWGIERYIENPGIALGRMLLRGAKASSANTASGNSLSHQVGRSNS